MIRSTLVLESWTSKKNFDNKSMSFYDFQSIDAMIFLMNVKELVLVHKDQVSGESRTMLVSGTKFFNSLEYRTYKGKRFIVYRY